MRRGMAGRGSSDRAPIAVTQRGAKPMSRPRCARRARAIAQTYSGAANQATEAWVAPAFANDANVRMSCEDRSVLPESAYCGVGSIREGHRGAAGNVSGELGIAERGAACLGISRKEGLFEAVAP